ncbi:MAG: DUF1792 domain-containing protein [Alphaproteobacteria bacterium]|nr:DUF1792 domain-containing protein [Alphaproteobacteria bacterium]
MLKKFFKRLKFIYRFDDQYIDSLMNELKYEMADEIKSLAIPKIMTEDETLDVLINERKSICRFGDGELNIINGKDIPFQTFNPKLQKRLIEVLSSKDNKIMVGLPRIAFYSKQNITPENKNFWRKKGNRFRSAILPYIDMRWQYYPSEVSLAYSYYINYDIEGYFNKFRKIWKNREVVVITGQTVFNKITHNIFDNAKSVEFMYAPGMNAFDEYDDILNKALTIDKNKIVIAILGPTAKPLCYDLALKGYQALVLGHIAKSYDLYKKNIKTNDKGVNFYRPD